MGRELVTGERMLADVAKGYHVLFTHLDLVLDFVKFWSVPEGVNDVFFAKVNLVI